MAKVKIETNGYVRYKCPGCKHDHSVPAERWAFNGDINNPTLNPSVRHYTEQTTICHYFIRNGKIEYCGDCQHELSGKIVEMEEMNDE